MDSLSELSELISEMPRPNSDSDWPYRSVTILTLTFWWFWVLLTPLIHKVDIKILWRGDCYLEINAHFKMFDSFVNRQSYDRHKLHFVCLNGNVANISRPKLIFYLTTVLGFSIISYKQTFTLQSKNYFSLTMSTIIYK